MDGLESGGATDLSCDWSECGGLISIHGGRIRYGTSVNKTSVFDMG